MSESCGERNDGAASMSRGSNGEREAPSSGERRDVVCGDPWLSKVTELHARVEDLRGHLRAALKHDSPRMERCVLDATLKLLVHSLYGTDAALHQHISEYYLQEVLCALLYMMGDTKEGDVGDTESALERARHHVHETSLQASEQVSPYISTSERLLCRDLFLTVVFKGNIPVFHSIQALYPLMIGVAPNRADPLKEEDRGVEAGVAANVVTSSQNNICDGLFDSPRFRRRRAELSATLNGLILHGTNGNRDLGPSAADKAFDSGVNGHGPQSEERRSGVYALIRVLVFDDRITQDATVDAALHIAKLLGIPMNDVWMPVEDAHKNAQENEKSGCFAYIRRKVDVEEQMKAIDSQLVGISELHAVEGGSAEDHGGANTNDRNPSPSEKVVPRYIRQLKQVHTLPLETRSDRLHMVLVAVTNYMLKLPVDVPTNTAAHQLAYRRFFYLNKYYLSPAFSPLALRKSCRTDGMIAAGRRVEASAARLWSLADGVSSGMSSRALLTALELVSGGVVELLCVLADLRSGCELHRLLSALWQTLSIGLPYDAEEIAYTLLDGCEGNTLMVHSLWPAADSLTAEHVRVIPHNTEPSTEPGEVIRQSTSQDNSPDALRRRRYLTLLNLLQNNDKIPAAFVSAVFRTALTRCQQALYSPDEVPNSVRDARKGDASHANENPDDAETNKLALLQRVFGQKQRAVDLTSSSVQHLVEFVEASVLTFDSKAVFGDNPSTVTVLDIVAKTLTLTTATWQWSVLLLTQVLAAPESCEAYSTRLLASLQTVSALLNDDALHAALAIAESGTLSTLRPDTTTITTTTVSSTIAGAAHLPSHSMNESEESDVKRLEEFKSQRFVAKELVEKRIEEVRAALAEMEAANFKDDPHQPLLDEKDSTGPPKSRAELQRRRNAAEKARGVANAPVVVRSIATLCQDVERHLLTRARAPLAVSLNSLVSAVEELSIPLASESGAQWPHYEVGQKLVNSCLRVLAETDDTCAAVLVIRILSTVSLRRLDSPNSAYISQKIVQCLLVEEMTVAAKPGVWRSILPHTLMPSSASHSDRLKLRLLDVVLGICDYDEDDALTLRHMDDRARELYGDRNSFASILMNLVAGSGGNSSSRSSAVAVAATHLLGHYAAAVFPRVSLTMLCDFCKTVFRLSPHTMVKAASAAMLETVSHFVYSHNLMTTLENVELDTLHTIANAMANYYEANPSAGGTGTGAAADETVERHCEVIRMHGSEVLRLLRELAQRPLIENING